MKNEPLKKDKDSGIDDREQFQKSEGYKESTSEYPDHRLQQNKQVLTPSELGVDSGLVKGTVAPSKETIIPKAASEIRSKVQVKPDSSVTIEDGKQVGGVPLSTNIATRTFAGAGAQSPADDMSRNPGTPGGIRPSTRLGKKISEQNFEINNTISEQVTPVYDEAKDLRESPDSVQGYNGRKQFKQARGKKNAGASPQDLLFDRSADILYHDEMVYTEGQILDSIVDTAGYPTRTFVGSGVTGADDNGYAAIEKPMQKGNYTLDSMKVDITSGHISGISFNESRFKPSTSYKERDVSNMNWQVDANNVTEATINMQTKLGRETSENWSPLGYVVEQPYQLNMLYHDMENTIGSVSAAVYRGATSALAYQLNMLGKDGAQTSSPAVGSCLSSFGNVANNSLFNSLDLKTVFNPGVTQYGAGTGIIAMFDSTGKYSNKADLLTLQRSMKLHLSQADNNMNPFHCKKNFIQAMNVAHTFSTPDGVYNPNLPVYTTRKMKMILPMSLNYFLEGWQNPHTASSSVVGVTIDPYTGTTTQMTYSYNDLRNRYTMPVKNPLVEGICRWLLMHESDLVKSFGNNRTVSMDCDIDFTNPTLFELILCSAMQDIAFMRNTYFKDILFAGEQSEYIWSDLTSLKELNPLWSTQLSIKAYDSPLMLGKLCDAAKIRLMWPELFTVQSEQTGDGADYLAPWYFNEQQFNDEPDSNGSFLSEHNAATMTMPSIRSGVRHDYVDVIYAMSERDVRLCLDRLTTLPCQNVSTIAYGTSSATSYIPLGGMYYTTLTSNASSNTHIRAYRYDTHSDGRVMVTYDDDLTYASLMCTPRELGFLQPGLAVDHANITAITVNNSSPITSATANITFDSNRKIVGTSGALVGHWVTPYGAVIDGSTGWSLRSYAAAGYGSEVTAKSISITAALQQDYIDYYASRSVAEVAANNSFVAKRGYAPCLSALLAAGSTSGLNQSFVTFAPVYALNALVPTGDTVVSFVPALWSILDRVFFPVNPFENSLIVGESSEVKAGALIDPMENAFMFGVSGTLASDYNQDVLERLDNFDQLNLNYLEDDFIKNSLIFRE